MTTRRGTQHTLKPKVLTAVLNLQRFTAQDLVSAAKLRDRKQAYAQLQTLQEDDLIFGENMASERANRPTVLYQVRPEKIQEIARTLEEYGLPAPEPITKEKDEALARADNLLSDAEGRLSTIKPTHLKRSDIDEAAAQLEKAGKLLSDVDIELDTARMESEGYGKGDQEIAQMAFRLDEGRKTLRGLDKALRIRRTVISLTEFLKDWIKKRPSTVEEARKLLQKREGMLATELVLDVLAPAFHNPELMPAVLASQAIRTNDLELISRCLMELSQEAHTWWRYNLLNTKYLQGRFEEAYEKWPDVYFELAKNAQCVADKGRATGIYVFDPKDMKLESLLPLMRKYDVSIVSPHTLDFWTLNEEIVRPLLVDPLSEARSEAGPLTNTVPLSQTEGSGPLWILYAYGPLTAAIRQWPGAPPLRVAASVDCLRPERIDVPKIANALRDEKGVVVLETRDPQAHHVFRTDVETALGDVCEIASFARV